MDCGDNGPDYNLGHTHADALSILLSSENKEILVDSGVFTYFPGKRRDDCRSTKAHNTVEIDGKNSAEIWSAFRVARRGHSKYFFRNNSDNVLIKACHDGYAKCMKECILHYRTVKIGNDRLTVKDYIKGKRDHAAVARFHIGPDCNLIRLNGNECVIDDHILLRSSHPIRISDCEIAGSFGVTRKAKCIEIEFKDTYCVKTDFLFIKEKENG